MRYLIFLLLLSGCATTTWTPRNEGCPEYRAYLWDRLNQHKISWEEWEDEMVISCELERAKISKEGLK